MNMRKVLLFTVALFSFLSALQAQIVPTVVFRERFDAPSGPDSVITYNRNPLITAAWNDTNQLFVSPGFSYHTQIVPFDSVIMETQSFSTVGNTFVRLTFNHICKIFSGQRGYIQASNNGGTTWVTLGATHYRGSSPQFAGNGYFNELSYPAAGGTPYWGGVSGVTPPPLMPTNQWWAQETFNVSAILGGTNGFPNCKIRFIAAHAVNVPINPAGWYVDNMLVEAAPCELFPPTYTYTNPAPYTFNKPIGARYMASQAVNIKVRDEGQGVKRDSILVFWRVNGGSWQSAAMTPSSTAAPVCRDSISLTYTWNNIALFDTIDWYIEMFDCACPNKTRDPLITALPNYYTFWRDVAPPAICGPTYPNSFPLVVTTLPFTETFESGMWVAGTGTGATGTQHRGSFPTDNPPLGMNWSVSPNPTQTGFAWSVRTGTTGTALTGPSGNNTPGGSKYVYSEASQGNGSATAPITTQLITPCIDLTTVSCAGLEFYYHMYGSDIDRLRIDIDTGSATNKYVNGVFIIIGQQQTSETAPYRRAFVSLEQFAGRIIRIRFTARKNTTTANDKNDIAIDDIKVYIPNPTDVEMTSFQTPVNGFCSYAQEDVRVCFQNQGCLTRTSVPLAFRVEYTATGSTTPTSVTVSRDTLYASVPSGKDTCFTFNPKANLSQFGTYRIWAWAEVPGDNVATNDTLGPFFIEHRQPINTFPYLMDFDAPGFVGGDGTTNNPGVIPTTDWDRVPNPTTNAYAFHVMSGKTPTIATGPRRDYSGSGNYLYAEGNYGTVVPVNALFASKCINLSGLANPTFEFMYHFYGVDGGLIRVQVVPSGSNAWVNVASAVVTGQQQTGSIQQWRYLQADLSAYLNQTIKVRIVAQKSGTGNAADIAVDNLRIFSRIATDVGIENITSPVQRVNLGPTAPAQPPIFTIRNFGTQSVTGVPITYTITPLCGPNANVPVSYTTNFTGTIAAGASASFTVPTPLPTYPEGDFRLCVTTAKTGDTYAFNNQVCENFVGWPQNFIQNGFVETFDNCASGTASGFFINGDYRAYQFGTPPGGASSAPYCYSAQLMGNSVNQNYSIYANTNEYLFSPQFRGFDTIVGAELWFRHKFNFTNNAVGIVERQVGTVWETLGIEDVTNLIGFNWYNSSNLTQIGGGSGWTGPSSGFSGANAQNWITSYWPLNLYNFSSAPLILRWRQFGGGGGGTGWSIDNVEIRIPPQNSAAPISVESEAYFFIPDVPNTIQVRIQNTGAKRLDSCMVSYEIDNSGSWSTPQKVVFSPPLGKGATSPWIILNQDWMNPSSGSHTICVATLLPNNKLDNFTPDDTLCTNVVVLDKIIMANDSSYCNNFEDASKVEWVALNTFIKSGLVSWQKGTPNQAPIVGAHSAPNAWMTNLSNNYKLRDSSSLFTPVFVLDSGEVYEMSFWHNFKTELYHDGGTVDVTFNGGLKWHTIGFVLPNGNWYNTNHVTSLDVLNPGWSGESNGWIQSKIKVQFDSSHSAIFRFRFGSDHSYEFAGWAVDDFCFSEATGSADQFIGVDEEIMSDLIGIGNIIPNPSSGSTYVPYVMNTPNDVTFTIYNLLGQPVLKETQRAEPGLNKLEFDVTGWSSGMYIIGIEVNGEYHTRKMIVR